MNELITEEVDNKPQNSHNCADVTADDFLSNKKGTILIKRAFDIIFSTFGLICTAPIFLIVAILIKADSPGPVFYKQIRVGKDGREFFIYKFRKMRSDVGDKGLKITTSNDSRMTDIGKVLRQYKLDELPQIWNVLKGDMSIVGPRPEVPNYVALYNNEQREILKIKPGITDYASLEYFDEGDLLEKQSDPNLFYIETLMPSKIELNLDYIRNMSVKTDLRIIFLTFLKIFRKVGEIK